MTKKELQGINKGINKELRQLRGILNTPHVDGLTADLIGSQIIKNLKWKKEINETLTTTTN